MTIEFMYHSARLGSPGLPGLTEPGTKPGTEPPLDAPRGDRRGHRDHRGEGEAEEAGNSMGTPGNLAWEKAGKMVISRQNVEKMGDFPVISLIDGVFWS